jgi:hypothetical protein
VAKRSPLNERYGKHTAPAGKTRKSAAAAKPKRARAEGSAASWSKKKPPAGRRERLALHPPTPEYRKWRRIWWGLLGSAMVLSTLAWWLWRDDAGRVWGNWVLGGGYVAIFAAISIDWVKMRPLRKEWLASRGDADSAS